MKKIFCYLSVAAILGAVSVPCFQMVENLVSPEKKVSLGVRAKYTPTIHPEDPYYTGAKKYGSYTQSILFNNIGDMEAVWENYTGKGITVAIIDSGIDFNRGDFEGAVDPKSGYFYTVYESDAPDSPYETKFEEGIDKLSHDWDDGSFDDHGTKIAGVIGARKNSEGVVGVAYECNLLIIKCDLDDASIKEAIKYCTDNGADIINMSFGAYAEPYYDHNEHIYYDKENEDYYPGIETSAVEEINYAHDHGVILVSAAGNECTDTHSYPVCNDHVIGVGALALNSKTQAADYSNYNLATDTPETNPSVDISAPGSVLTDSYSGSKLNPNSTYIITNGTSFSCPVVAAAAALWKQKYPNSTPEQFEKALYDSANDIGAKGWDTKFGFGGLNIEKLMEQELQEIDAPTSLTLDKSSLNLNKGDSAKLVATVLPDKFADQITFTSSNPGVATVSNSGNIIALNAGSTIITVKVGDLTKTCTVVVADPSGGGSSEGGSPEVSNPTCGGEIVTTSTFLSLLSILGFFLIKSRKKDK